MSSLDGRRPHSCSPVFGSIGAKTGELGQATPFNFNFLAHMAIPLVDNSINIEYNRDQLQFFHKPVYLNSVSRKQKFSIPGLDCNKNSI